MRGPSFLEVTGEQHSDEQAGAQDRKPLILSQNDKMRGFLPYVFTVFDPVMWYVGSRIKEGCIGRQGKNHAEKESAPFSLRLLGLGFWQAWWMLILCTPVVLPTTTFLAGIRPSAWALLLTSVGFIVIALMARTVDSFIGYRRMFLIAGATCTGGTVLCFILKGIVDASVAPALYLAAMGIASCGNACLLVMWGELWATLATDRVNQYLFSSYAFAFVLFFGVQALPDSVSFLLIGILPLVSCAILYSSQNETRRAPSSVEFVVDKTLMIKAGVAIVIAGLAYGMSQSFYANIAMPHITDGRPDLLVAGMGVAALTLYVVIGRPVGDALVMYRPIAPALSIGLILLAVLPLSSSYFGNGLIVIGGYCLDMIIMLISTDIAFRAKRSVALFFSCTILVLRLATVVGLASVDLAVEFRFIGPYSQVPLLITGAIAIIIVGMLLFTHGDLQRFYQPQPVVRPSADMNGHCEALAGRCGLTARETEVLALLASGRNVPYICKNLCIAESTARHHVGSIYRKLGVCDRQGMLDVILQE